MGCMGRMRSEIFKLAENLLAARRVGEALRLYEEAERLGFEPDLCAAGRWNCHMLRGDFLLAWQAGSSSLLGRPPARWPSCDPSLPARAGRHHSVHSICAVDSQAGSQLDD